MAAPRTSPLTTRPTPSSGSVSHASGLPARTATRSPRCTARPASRPRSSVAARVVTQGRRRRPIITESEFLARRESVDRVMVVRQSGERTQIAVLEDGMLVEHYVNRAVVDVLHRQRLPRSGAERPALAWRRRSSTSARAATPCSTPARSTGTPPASTASRAASSTRSSPATRCSSRSRRTRSATRASRLTAQISLPGRFLVYVPDGSMTGISRKLPDTERAAPQEDPQGGRPRGRRRHRAHGRRGCHRGRAHAATSPGSPRSGRTSARRSKTATAPALLYGEPDLIVRVIRDVFNEDFDKLVVDGDDAWDTVAVLHRPRRPRPRRPRLVALDRGQATSSPRTASTSSSPRRSTARCGCPRAARSSSTAPRR